MESYFDEVGVGKSIEETAEDSASDILEELSKHGLFDSESDEFVESIRLFLFQRIDDAIRDHV